MQQILSTDTEALVFKYVDILSLLPCVAVLREFLPAQLAEYYIELVDAFWATEEDFWTVDVTLPLGVPEHPRTFKPASISRGAAGQYFCMAAKELLNNIAQSFVDADDIFLTLPGMASVSTLQTYILNFQTCVDCTVAGGRRMAGLDPKVAPQTSAASDTQWLRALERCNRDNDDIDVLVWLLGKGAWCREHYPAAWDDANTGVTILHFVVYGVVGTLILAEYWSQSNSDSAGPDSPQSTLESPALMRQQHLRPVRQRTTCRRK